MKARYFLVFTVLVLLAFFYFLITSNNYSTIQDLIKNEYESQQVEIFRKSENEALLFVLSKNNNYLKAVNTRKKLTGWQIIDVSSEINLADVKGPAILPNKVLFKLNKNNWLMYGVTPSQGLENITIDRNAATMLPFNSYFTGYEEQRLTIWYLTADEPLDFNKVDYKLKNK